MTDREEIIARNPLESVFAARGARLKKQPGNASFTTNHCPLTEHKPAHMCVSLNGNVWHCHDCGKGGSVIDFVAFAEGLTIGAAMAKLGGEQEEIQRPAKPTAGAKIAKIYPYEDENGEVLYEVCRMEPKDFRQRHRDANGQWVWNMTGVRRVLYNLPAVTKADMVWIVEGEKDADALNAFGLCATCNVGGAGKWDASYTASLKDKDVVLCGDTDEPGQKHVAKVIESLGGAVRTTRQVRVPAPFKDVSDWLASGADPAGLLDLAAAAEVLTRGVRLPLKSMADLEREYRYFVKHSAVCSLSLVDWLPSTGSAETLIRPLVPGELMVFLAGTGVGKTMLLQNLALHTGLITLLFELELPGTLTFERFTAMALGRHGHTIEHDYRRDLTPAWQETGRLDHIYVCSESKMTPKELERIIQNAALKTSIRPALVLVDYIQLMQGQGDRRERVSDAAEELKVIAKATNTIIVIASQVARKEKPNEGITLYDGKESGSIENSAGLVIGAWRDPNDKSLMTLKILKNTKGTAGGEIACKIRDGLVIREAREK